MSRQLMRIVWPAFIAACLLELVVFALIDPQDLHWGGQALSGSRQGIYTAAFFVFWLVAAVASALTVLLDAPLQVTQAQERVRE